MSRDDICIQMRCQESSEEEARDVSCVVLHLYRG